MGVRLRQKRKAMRLSQKELAAILHLSETHISNLERGCYLPSLSCLLRLCDVLGETPDYFLFGFLPRPYASVSAQHPISLSSDCRKTAKNAEDEADAADLANR